MSNQDELLSNYTLLINNGTYSSDFIGNPFIFVLVKSIAFPFKPYQLLVVSHFGSCNVSLMNTVELSLNAVCNVQCALCIPDNNL